MSKIKVQEIEHTTSSTPAITIAQNNDVTCNAGLTATSFTGDGANLTNLPLTDLDAANLTSGLIPDARFPATLPAVNGSNLTGINAGALQHIADYAVPTGSNVTTFQVGSLVGVSADVFPIDTVYLLRGQFNNAYYSSGPELNIYPEIYDSSSGSTYNWNTGLSYCDTVTRYYNGNTTNQSSSYWQVYSGGYTDYHFNFEMVFSTYERPWAHTKLRGLYSPTMFVDGNHRWTNSPDTSRIQGFTFYNHYGYPWDDKTKLSLYKYTNY